MKDVTKGFLITVAGAIICREFYARGYNKGIDECTRIARTAINVKKAVEKENEERS